MNGYAFLLFFVLLSLVITLRINAVALSRSAGMARARVGNVFKDMKQDTTAKLQVGTAGHSPKMVVFSGEQFYRNYEQLIPAVREFIEECLEHTRDISFTFLGGPRLFVKKRGVDIKKIHPTLELMVEYPEYVRLYIVNQKRFPFHGFYCNLSDFNYAEAPHYELSQAIAWKFEAHPEYPKYFDRYLEKVVEAYGARLVQFDPERDKFLIHDEKSGQAEELSGDDKIFHHPNKFMRTCYGLVRGRRNKLGDQIEFAKSELGFDYANWKPNSDRIFSRQDINALNQ